jgi:5-methylcytosine-specific restriction enzyme B
MNLSHVERYFADFLSVMESKEEISLSSKDELTNLAISKLRLPSNLFIIGTVNIDETTYMFSPKVLDRANTIEFRVSKQEIGNFLRKVPEVNMSLLSTKGAPMAQSFLKLAENKEFIDSEMSDVNTALVNFFDQLKKTGAEFGYRGASEIIRLINQLGIIDADMSENDKIDIAIMQKLLPKLHGSRRKLCPVLKVLGGFCVDEQVKNIEKEVFDADDFDFSSSEKVKYPLSLEKITRMYKGAMDNGFASYAEA